MTASNKRIAIASCPDKVNFGSVLQSYATQRFVGDLGYEALTIDKSGLGGEISRGRRSYYAENILNLDLYRAKLGFVGHRIKQKLDRDFGAKMAERRSAFGRFDAAHFNYTPRTSSFDELGKLSREFGAVVVGSDQLWLPVNIAGDFYTLSFVERPARKIAYATSFGVSTLPERYLRRTGEFLSDFSVISVREDTGAELVRQATGNACRVVCDPTMLLTAEQWLSTADPAFELPSEPYVFCYFLGKNIWNRECAIEYARERGLKIVVIAHPDEYVPFDDTYGDYYPYNAGPAEWVRLVAGASAVFTDSFHGSVFSNLFGRPFFSFRRHENAGAQSTNSRIDTLLNVLGDPDRICESKEQFRSAAGEDIDFDEVKERLEAYRSESAGFLRSALAGEVD